MIYLKCNCGRLLGNKQLPYEEKEYEVNNDNSLSKEEKVAILSQFIEEELLLYKYCCKKNLLTYQNNIKIIK